MKSSSLFVAIVIGSLALFALGYFVGRVIPVEQQVITITTVTTTVEIQEVTKIGVLSSIQSGANIAGSPLTILAFQDGSKLTLYDRWSLEIGKTYEIKYFMDGEDIILKSLRILES